jgi:hypothetical protein
MASSLEDFDAQFFSQPPMAMSAGGLDSFDREFFGLGDPDEVRLREVQARIDALSGGSASKETSLLDYPLAFARGAVGATEAMTNVAGADNAVSGGLRTGREWLGEQESSGMQAMRAEHARRSAEAEGTGWWNEATTAIDNVTDAPLLYSLEAAGSLVPMLPAMLLPGGQAAVAGAVAGAGLRGAAFGGLGITQGVGAVKGAQYESVKNYWTRQGATPEEAERRAVSAQSYSSDNAVDLLAGGALGYVAGRTGAEGFLGGLNPMAGAGVFKRGAIGAVTEAVPEGMQGGQEKLAANRALIREGDEERDPWQGVLGQGLQEGLMSMGVGGGLAMAQPYTPTTAELDLLKRQEIGDRQTGHQWFDNIDPDAGLNTVGTPWRPAPIRETTDEQLGTGLSATPPGTNSTLTQDEIDSLLNPPQDQAPINVTWGSGPRAAEVNQQKPALAEAQSPDNGDSFFTTEAGKAYITKTGAPNKTRASAMALIRKQAKTAAGRKKLVSEAETTGSVFRRDAITHVLNEVAAQNVSPTGSDVQTVGVGAQGRGANPGADVEAGQRSGGQPPAVGTGPAGTTAQQGAVGPAPAGEVMELSRAGDVSSVAPKSLTSIAEQNNAEAARVRQNAAAAWLPKQTAAKDAAPKKDLAPKEERQAALEAEVSALEARLHAIGKQNGLPDWANKTDNFLAGEVVGSPGKFDWTLRGLLHDPEVSSLISTITTLRSHKVTDQGEGQANRGTKGGKVLGAPVPVTQITDPHDRSIVMDFMGVDERGNPVDQNRDASLEAVARRHVNQTGKNKGKPLTKQQVSRVLEKYNYNQATRIMERHRAGALAAQPQQDEAPTSRAILAEDVPFKVGSDENVGAEEIATAANPSGALNSTDKVGKQVKALAAVLTDPNAEYDDVRAHIARYQNTENIRKLLERAEELSEVTLDAIVDELTARNKKLASGKVAPTTASPALERGKARAKEEAVEVSEQDMTDTGKMWDNLTAIGEIDIAWSDLDPLDQAFAAIERSRVLNGTPEVDSYKPVRNRLKSVSENEALRERANANKQRPAGNEGDAGVNDSERPRQVGEQSEAGGDVQAGSPSLQAGKEVLVGRAARKALLKSRPLKAIRVETGQTELVENTDTGDIVEIPVRMDADSVLNKAALELRAVTKLLNDVEDGKMPC